MTETKRKRCARGTRYNKKTKNCDPVKKKENSPFLPPTQNVVENAVPTPVVKVPTPVVKVPTPVVKVPTPVVKVPTPVVKVPTPKIASVPKKELKMSIRAVKTASPKDPRKKLLVIFDIDETLIHFNKNFKENGQPAISFRPNVCKLLKFLNDDPFFHVGLWTYSDGEYAKGIANNLIKHCNLRSDFFSCILYDKYIELDEDGITKNLSVFYDSDVFEELRDRVNKYEKTHEDYALGFNKNISWMRKFSKFNTVLVDDRYGNMSNEVNIENSLLIEPYHDNPSDDICIKLMNIFKIMKNDIENCTSAEIDDAFKREAILSFNRAKRMGLMKYYKKYKIDFEFKNANNAKKNVYKPMSEKIYNKLFPNGLVSKDKSEITFISIGNTHQGENNGGFTLIDANPFSLKLTVVEKKKASPLRPLPNPSALKCQPGYVPKCVKVQTLKTAGGNARMTRRHRHIGANI